MCSLRCKMVLLSAPVPPISCQPFLPIFATVETILHALILPLRSRQMLLANQSLSSLSALSPVFLLSSQWRIMRKSVQMSSNYLGSGSLAVSKWHTSKHLPFKNSLIFYRSSCSLVLVPEQHHLLSAVCTVCETLYIPSLLKGICQILLTWLPWAVLFLYTKSYDFVDYSTFSHCSGESDFLAVFYFLSRGRSPQQ